MPAIDTTHIILIILTIFVASSVATAIGFGLGIILLSFLQFFLPPIQLVGLVFIVGIGNSSLRTLQTRRIRTAGIGWRVILPGFLALPVGLAVLCFADPVFLKRFFSTVILASAMLLVFIRPKTSSAPANHRSASIVQIALGALAGFIGSASGMAGPPIVLCSLIQNWAKMVAHAVFARFFLVNGVTGATVLFATGRYQDQTIILALCLMPVVVLGVVVGTWLRDRISQKQFRRYTMICLILLALGGFLNTFFLTP